MVLVKICGLTREADVELACASGADRVGLVAVATSPRRVEFAHLAKLAALAESAGVDAWVVAAWRADPALRTSSNHVDGLDRLVANTPALRGVQLHSGETPADIADFRLCAPDRLLVKGLGVGDAADLASAVDYPDADLFLLDARPPPGAARHGGFGRSFDWSLLAGARLPKPWVLAGGLNPDNVADAIRASGARAVDVSSGVEAAPGVKDPAKMRSFVAAAKSA